MEDHDFICFMHFGLEKLIVTMIIRIVLNFMDRKWFTCLSNEKYFPLDLNPFVLLNQNDQ